MGIGDGGVHAAPSARRHPVHRIADEDHAAITQPARGLRRERETVAGQDLDLEVRPACGLADQCDTALGRERRGHGGLVHAGGQRDAKDEPPIGPARDEDCRRTRVAAQHVQPIQRVAKHVGKVRPEQDAEELAQVVRTLHRDPERLAHRRAVAIRADQVAGTHGRHLATCTIAELCRHAVRVLVERDELRREPDLAHAERAIVVDEDGLQMVLRAHRGRRRADRRGRVGVGEPEGALDDIGIAQPADARLPRHDPPTPAAHVVIHPPTAEDLHRARADAGGAREDRRRRVTLDHERAHAVAGEADRRDEARRAGSDDERRHLLGARGGGPGIDGVHVGLLIWSDNVSDIGQSVR